MISMQVIVRGDIKIQRLMVPLSVEKKAYKLSQFVIRQRTDDGLALGNTMTGEVVVLNPDEEDLISGEDKRLIIEQMEGIVEDLRENRTEQYKKRAETAEATLERLHELEDCDEEKFST